MWIVPKHKFFLHIFRINNCQPGFWWIDCQVCHGEGPTTEASHEKAALEALKVLSELGLDIVSPNKESQEK